MFSLVGGLVLTLGAGWFPRKAFAWVSVPLLSFVAMKEKDAAERLERAIKLGLSPEGDRQDFFIVEFEPIHLHEDLHFLIGKQVFSTQEMFLLEKANKDLRSESSAALSAIDFQKLLDVSAARQADEEFMKSLTKDS